MAETLKTADKRCSEYAEEKNMGNFLQWILPCVLLVIALALSIYDFNNQMDTAIQTVVDDQAEQIGLYYAAGVEDKLKRWEISRMRLRRSWRAARTEVMRF